MRNLTNLTPTEFENLVFDLMITRGMANVTWRTPGADGGRDIEGIVFDEDLSGFQTSSTWYVECKRYSNNSIDWPTIYGKIAYADSNHADVLLICTSSLISPTATTHVDKWNSDKRSPLIRLWPCHELESQLQLHPDLMLKYGLSDVPSTPGATFVALALALSKSVASHYGSLVFRDEKPDLMLQASQAFADLLLRRMEDIEREGRITPQYFQSVDQLPDNCVFEGKSFEIDVAGATAFIVYLAALSKSGLKITNTSEGVYIMTSTDGKDISEFVCRYDMTFSAIAIWGDFEYIISTPNICFRSR